MSKLVFVDNTASATADFHPDATATFVHGNTGKVGFWSVDLSDHIDGGSAAQMLITSNVLIQKRFMITQSNGSSKKPYASQIINAEDVYKITYTTYKAAAKATTALGAINSVANSVLYSFKVITHGGPLDYETFLNPGDPNAYERTSSVFNFEYTSDASATAIEVADAFRDALNENEASPIQFSGSAGSATGEFVAKNHGVGFTLINSGAAIGASGTEAWEVAGASATYAPTVGVGDPHFVIGEEKKYLGSKTGYHNKLHLPMTPDTYATSTHGGWDLMTITLKDPKENVLRTGAGSDLKQIDIYLPANATVGSTTLDSTLGQAGVDIWNATAGTTIDLYTTA